MEKDIISLLVIVGCLIGFSILWYYFLKYQYCLYREREIHDQHT